MQSPMTIQDLADSLGLTRRAVRFYVQQKLLPPPAGAGRGSYYNSDHLTRLKRVVELQRVGHSLEEIRQILAGKPATLSPARDRPGLSAQLWTRLTVATGVELHFDTTRRPLDARTLLRLREGLRAILEETA